MKVSPFSLSSDAFCSTSSFADAVKSLLSLSLTSRSPLSSARRELYRHPLDDDTVTNHPSSPALLLRTVTDSPHLASLVRHLEGLGCPILKGCTPGEDLVEQQAKLVKFCPRLNSLTLFIVDSAQAQDLPPFISRLSQLKALVLDVAVAAGDPRTLLSAWNSAYTSSSPASHPRLTVRPRYLRIPPSAGSDRETPIPSFITDLAFALNPAEVNFVEGYRTSDLDIATLTALAVIVAKSRLRSFVYEGTPLDVSVSDRLWSSCEIDELDVPSVFFTSFPAVTSFTLTWTCRMTVVKLSLLANTSPSLQSLNFTGTMWDVGPEQFVVPSGGVSVIEAQLIDLLRRLPALRKVNLGLFRVHGYKEPFSRLEGYCRSRMPQLELSWQGVVEEVTG